MRDEISYPIGTPGVPWGEPEKATWRSRQSICRSYEADVVLRLERLASSHAVFEYGRLNYEPHEYSLLAARTLNWQERLPCALVTGGVHGYETSGTQGALEFLERHSGAYQGRLNLMVAPCISPWSYETVNRWNPYAVDPNRSFHEASPSQEATALMQLIRPLLNRVLVHVDLHETTDTDETEFRPALAARDGVEHVPGNIPDGFYLVDDSDSPNVVFQQALIAAVAQITHIAPADENGEIIGCRVTSPGVINYPLKQLGLCASVTQAPFRTTTEVYPDSTLSTPEQCTAAQARAVCAALDFALATLSV